MAIHRTVLRNVSTAVILRPTKIESRLATLDSSQEVLLQVMCVDCGLTSTQPDQPNDESVKIPSARKTNINSQQRARRSHIFKFNVELPMVRQARHLPLILIVFQLLIRCVHPRASDIMRTWSTIARSVILCFIFRFYLWVYH